MSKYQEDVKRVADRRRAQMEAMRAKGKTFQQIADHFGVSRQRAHQIITERGALLKGAKP